MPERTPHPGSELPLGRIALAGAAIAGTVLLAVGAVLGWLHEARLPPGGQRLVRPYDLVLPAPALQSAPQPDLRTYRTAKQLLLHETRWLDAGHRIARIPIEDAMALMAQRAAASAPEGGR